MSKPAGITDLDRSHLIRALGNGIAVGVIEESVGTRDGKKAVMAGGVMTASSIVTDILGDKNPLAMQTYWGKDALAFSDAAVYAGAMFGIDRGYYNHKPNWRDVFRDFLFGFGSSFVTDIVTAPLDAMIASSKSGPIGAQPAVSGPTEPASKRIPHASY